jgi:two-component system, NarL family, nitrate/nitrite response regulator NarL
MEAPATPHPLPAARVGDTDTKRDGPPRVVVLHREEVVRCGVESMLASLDWVGDVHACGDESHMLTLARDGRTDVVVSWATGEDDGLEPYVREALDGRSRVLLILPSVDDVAVDTAADLRADGYVLQAGLTAERLGEALRRVCRGEFPVPTSLVRELMSTVRRATRAQADRLLTLSPREQQTLGLLTEGFSNKQIARRLGISEHGAKRHVASVLAKLNCPNRTLAVARAVREGLVPGLTPDTARG